MRGNVTGMEAVVETDVLGVPYERQIIDLGEDDEGPVVATLVRRRAERRTGRAVLYVHGFIDYFFQTHLADFFVERGWDFYAIDLRKYGRSLLPHQTPNFCRDLSDYFPELDTAANIIRADGNRCLLVNGHSTGGLITALWAHARRDAGVVDGLFLNSPFFDLNQSWFMRRPVAAAVARIARAAPYRIVRPGLPELYGQSLHAEHRGEWTYDLAWKPLAGFPVRAAWLAAIRRGQQQLRAGLAIPVPILVACSARHFRGSAWHDSAALTDAVLNVEHIVRWAPRLGRHVTLIRIDGGMHDLTLSGPAVRGEVFSELGRWIAAFVEPRAVEMTAAPGAANAMEAGGEAGAEPAQAPKNPDVAVSSIPATRPGDTGDERLSSPTSASAAGHDAAEVDGASSASPTPRAPAAGHER